MTDDVLDAEMRALLDLGRDHLAPDPATVARLRRRLEATVAVAGTGIGVAGLAKGLGVKALAIKLAVVTAVGVTAGAAIHVARIARTERDTQVTMPAIVPAPEREIDEDVRPSIAIAARDVSAAAAEGPPPAAIAPPHRAPDQQPRPTMIAPAPSPHATLARETELVERATKALRAGDLAVAREAIDTYMREAGGAGQLAEDVDAIEIELLCRANDPSASTRLAAFDARWPHAGQRHRLVAACKGEP